ncbi:MAG: lysylphosphatidylglycerol synthase transmembrane domain-containing protein [Cytophagales bacterium]|nr:lysylphosphatidylglycerol synthase transmembrane domain-containing protein [Cytophagales bacterium]
MFSKIRFFQDIFKALIFITLSTALIIYFLNKSKFDINTLPALFFRFNYYETIIIFIIWLQHLLLLSIKSYNLYRNASIDIKFVDCVKINYSGLFATYMLPSGTGMEIFKYYYLKKYTGGSTIRVAVLLIADKISSLLITLLFALTFGAGLLVYLQINTIILAILVFLIILSAIVCWILFSKYRYRILRVYKKLRMIKYTFYVYQFFIAILILLNGICFYFTISYFMHSNIPFFYFLQNIPVMVILDYLPIAVASIGVRENTAQILFNLSGFGSVAMYFIVARIFDFAMSMPGSIFALTAILKNKSSK